MYKYTQVGDGEQHRGSNGEADDSRQEPRGPIGSAIPKKESKV